MRPSSQHQSRSIVGVGLLLAGLALAGGNYDQFLAALAHRESGGKATVVNYAGYAGLYQMGEGALADAGYYRPDGTKKNDWRGSWTGKNGVTSLSAFLHSPDAQTQAITDYQSVLWRQIQARGLDRYVGQTINGQTITESALIGGAHLIGAGGLRRCLASGSGCKDGLGTTAASYMNRFGGYDVSGVIGRASLVTPAGSGSPGTGSGSGSGGSASSGGATPTYTELVPDETPAQAFESTSGYAPGEVQQTALEALSLAMLTWLAWTVWQQYHGWRRGRSTFNDMNVQIVRAIAIVLVLLGIVLA